LDTLGDRVDTASCGRIRTASGYGLQFFLADLVQIIKRLPGAEYIRMLVRETELELGDLGFQVADRSVHRTGTQWVYAIGGAGLTCQLAGQFVAFIGQAAHLGLQYADLRPGRLKTPVKITLTLEQTHVFGLERCQPVF